jgi:hypothetical protein
VTTLVGIEEERRSLCRVLNVPADMHGLERLLTWCDPSSGLRQRWAECAERATRCRNSNERNGALVSARLKRVEGLLDTLMAAPISPRPMGDRAATRSQVATPTCWRLFRSTSQVDIAPAIELPAPRDGHRARALDSNLLGENQLVAMGDAQAVMRVAVLDQDFSHRAKQLCRLETRDRRTTRGGLSGRRSNFRTERGKVQLSSISIHG